MIILARHGQTRFNLAGIIQGQTDSPLTSAGLAETHKMPGLISRFRPEMIYSSSLGRAAFSSSIYSQILSIPVRFRSALAELSCGKWEGLKRDDVVLGDRTIRPNWTNRPPGGESYQDGEKRLIPFIEEIRSLANDRCIIILAHAGLNRAFVRLFLDLKIEETLFVRFPHDTTYLIHTDGTVHRLGLSTGAGNGFLSEIQ
ncbi:MAG: histidine phosphatase family protein [Desulfomonilaceae bacterium]